LEKFFIDHREYRCVSDSKIAFIGLGVMGAAIAGHIAKAGFSVTVFNRNIEKSIDWINAFSNHRVSYAETARDASIDADFVISCVGKDSDLQQITTGDHGAFKTMKKGSIFIDHTTTSADIAIKLSKIATDAHIYFMDAPVSGGNLGARKGQLSIMCGGDREIYQLSKSILDLYSKGSSLIGNHGSGQLAKMVNQICIAGLIQGLAEGINFGKKAGLNMEKVLETISKGAASSWQMANRGTTMVDNKYDFGFAVDLMRKDLAIALNKGQELQAELPITKLVENFYEELQYAGYGKFDTTSLLLRLQNNFHDKQN
jgi:3-hydroxyisobutyrate dehydrogenase-like beta-hydroxyacid dehydrogenase